MFDYGRLLQPKRLGRVLDRNLKTIGFNKTLSSKTAERREWRNASAEKSVPP